MDTHSNVEVQGAAGEAGHPRLNAGRRRACLASIAAMAGGLVPGLAQAATRPVRPLLLHAFDGPAEGTQPNAPMARGPDGAWYGTASQGGPLGQGTIWRTTDGRTLTVLHAFASNGGPAWPLGALAIDADGSVYGRSVFGGPEGFGTIYRLSADGAIDVLHEFAPEYHNGTSGLLLAQDGWLYGTTYFGGEVGIGTVFRLARDGSAFETLHSFSGQPDSGYFPGAELIQASDGLFYGTTTASGVGAGTVFRMAPDGAMTVLHVFDGIDDGAIPSGPLIESAIDGALYGTTAAGGYAGGGPGTVFRIAAGDRFELVHRLAQDGSEGVSPKSLIEASDGQFYGCCFTMLFRMQRSGKFNPLYAFRGAARLQPGLAEVQPGVLVGSTHFGGPAASGTLFALRR